MILLGIVGTPASGKSTVAAHLQHKGALWVNADLIARDVLTEPDVVQTLTSHFGDSIRRQDASIDRSILAERVFGSSPETVAARKYLESVVHPVTRIRIVQQIRKAAQENVQVTILDIPLLFESKWDRSCDAIWCIDAPLEKRIRWAAERNWTPEELSRRESNQMPIAEKRHLSNLVLDNRATLEDLSRLADDGWSNLATINQVGQESPDQGHCLSD